MQLHELSEFLRLSAVLNYQLSAGFVNWDNVIRIIFGKKPIPSQEKDVLLQVLSYLDKVYGQKKRHIGSLSILHPLRVTTLLNELLERAGLLDVMTALLHDVFEDIHPDQFKNSNWIQYDKMFQDFIKKIPASDQWYLMERLQWLTKRPGDTYYSYIGRLLNQASHTPEVIRVKLADRLDNTLDMRIVLDDPLEEVNFFEYVFQIMFTNSFKYFNAIKPYSSVTILNDAERLYQLFKNTVLLSLVRKKNTWAANHSIQLVSNTLAHAGMKEAQRIFLQIIGYNELDMNKLRDLLMETMNYIHTGGVDMITPPDHKHRLNGLFMSFFDIPLKKFRRNQLAKLQQDKHLMVEAALAFIVIFINFINNENYYVRGISDEGVKPVS